MGFCTPLEHQRFLRQCPEFERMLVEDGFLLRKYWFSVSDAEQERRFEARLADPTKRWKLSEMDLESRRRFVDFSRAKDEMFVHTDTEHAPWWVIEADSKRAARLNCIAHLLSSIPYETLPARRVELPPRQPDDGYVRPDPSLMRYVPDHAATLVE
jgi:polyphosphate kinase 2 (PPK2 family)